MGLGKKWDPFARAVEDLAEYDFTGQSPVLQDVVAQLRDVLEQMVRVQAGEVRIVALGQSGSMKSTMLRLLLGSDFLRVGPGAVTVAATELRLTQADDAGRTPEIRVLTLTEEGARRRACALLDLTEDDPRPLTELLTVAHPNQKLVTAMAEAARTLGYGAAYDLAGYLDRGGALTFDAAGTGTELVARVTVGLPVSRDVWNLDWAGTRSVVVVDTPGKRAGGPLEDVIIQEMRDRAHIALLTMACSAGTSFAVPPAPPGSHPVLVATKLDAVDNPANANELKTLDGAVASNLGQLGGNGRQARIVAVCGPWAMGDQEAWARFDPDNPHAWHTAELKREGWREARRTATEPGPLQEAVFAALDDGGVGQLQRVIAELSAQDPGRLDEEELDRLIALGLKLVDDALERLPDPGEQEAVAARQRDRAAKDPTPIAELRQIAAKVSIDAVYGTSTWRAVRQAFQHRQDQWLGPAKDVGAALAGLDFDRLAHEAVNDAGELLNTELAAWQLEYTTAEFGAPGWRRPPGLDEATVSQAAGQFARLARQLVDRLTLGAGEDLTPDWLTFRKVARTRDELAKLLERLLLALFEATAVRARTDLIEFFKNPKNDLDDSELPFLFDDIRRDLLKLAEARSDGAD
ncbi:hypothetical protein Misp01_43180 [Microtetraspora sp. NBRC 13810]|uniref:hypothetical protein n=1 Tax=Microtetraspora sp. NBRC 13810 TaxID=3030990 RepID=UPI0024A10605|nr:hypothetical protein [Microtetraspora sp. NBRC 13810]GLW09189.1 hypothetical protein Misp01_43180 [Microtetraspora sp. NBRC 13810]